MDFLVQMLMSAKMTLAIRMHPAQILSDRIPALVTLVTVEVASSVRTLMNVSCNHVVAMPSAPIQTVVTPVLVMMATLETA